MADLKLFSIQNGQATELEGSEAHLERSLQAVIERNLETLLGIRFLASEYSTGPRHGGRIDSLGIDENGCPVIIEYKRSTNENVINQGLYYLDWLMDHQAEFKLLVMKAVGEQAAEQIDWTGPRLVCIAGGFTKYDDYAVQQMSRNIELIRYKKFGEELLLLELAKAAVAPASSPSGAVGGSSRDTKTISMVLEELQGPLASLYGEVRHHLLSLGDDVQEKTLQRYVAFKRIKNFACLEVYPSLNVVRICVKVDPKSIELEEGFTRDVSEIGHYGTGDLEISVASLADLERAKGLIQRSYDES